MAAAGEDSLGRQEPMQRYHGLDMLRAVAMLLGIVLHANLPFISAEILQDFQPGATPPPRPVYWEIIGIWIHQWRMPVFFLLAGFFAALVLERKGPRYFLQDRALRIGGSFAVFMLLFTLIIGKGWFELHHLWFLWYLLQFCLIAWLGWITGLGRWLRPLLWLLDRSWRLFLLYPAMLLLVLFTKSELMGHIIPEDLREFVPQGLIYYLSFFVLGLGFWQRRARIEDLACRPVWLSLLGASLLITVLLSVLGLAEVEADAVFVLLVPAGQLCLIFGIIGMAQGLVQRTGPVTQFLVESAFAVYLTHLYVVIGLGAWLILEGVSPHLSIPLSILMTVPICLALYLIFIRWTPLDWLLAGPHKARLRWPVGKTKGRPSGRPS